MDTISANAEGNAHYFELSSMDLKAFVNAVGQCRGDVILFTDEGDRFNLKSTLSKTMGFLALIEDGKFAGAKIYCPDPEDVTMLFRLGLFGETPNPSH